MNTSAAITQPNARLIGSQLPLSPSQQTTTCPQQASHYLQYVGFRGLLLKSEAREKAQATEQTSPPPSPEGRGLDPLTRSVYGSGVT